MKVLVLGTGSIGRRHTEVICSTGEHDVSVCDINLDSAKEVAEHFKLTEYYDDFKKAIDSDIDAVVICTPNNFHAEPAIRAMRKGAHVLVEKPISDSIGDAALMVEEADRSRIKIMVGYTLRCYPQLEYVKKMIDDDRIGQVVSFKSNLSAPRTLEFAKSTYRKNYSSGGGIIYDYSHEIDYLRFLFGSAVRYTCFKDLLCKKEQTCDDVAEIIIQFENDVLGSIHMDYIIRYGRSEERSVEIIGKGGVST